MSRVLSSVSCALGSFGRTSGHLRKVSERDESPNPKRIVTWRVCNDPCVVWMTELGFIWRITFDLGICIGWTFDGVWMTDCWLFGWITDCACKTSEGYKTSTTGAQRNLVIYHGGSLRRERQLNDASGCDGIRDLRRRGGLQGFDRTPRAARPVLLDHSVHALEGHLRKAQHYNIGLLTRA